MTDNFDDLLDQTEPCYVDYDPEKWTGPWVNSTEPEVAARLCAGCHVLEECLQYALDTNQRHHIWGGTTPDQRKELLKNARRSRIEEANPRPAQDTEPTD